MENAKAAPAMPRSLTDQELYKLCREYGMNAKHWLRKFAGLLPEVYKRKLYKKKNYVSIYEFGAKLAGMNYHTVDRILDIGEKLEDKPTLRTLFESGAQGWSKIEKVAYIATPENEKEWAEKVRTLPLHTLETYVKETRKSEGSNFREEFPLEGKFSGNGSRPKWNTITFYVSPAVEQKLRLLKQKIEKERTEMVGWNEVMQIMFQRLEEKEAGSEKQVCKESGSDKQVCLEEVKEKADDAEKNNEVTRYIPSEVRKVIVARSRGVCEFPDCNYAAEIYHHTRRFALKKNHDPNFIRALCKKHEGVLQAGLVTNEEGDPSTWRIRNAPEWWDLKNVIDEKVAAFRREPKLEPGA